MKIQNLEHVQKVRESHRLEMERLGIDEALISVIVETFYSRVREDQRLGPIFEKVVKDNWEPHLGKMKAFWSTIVLRTNRFQGEPMPAHQRLEGVSSADFDHWLEMFKTTLDDIGKSDEITQIFMPYAERMAVRLSSAMNLVD